jgi:hypothetical protein
VVAAELALSVRSVTVGCLVEVLCRILNIPTRVIAAVLDVREQNNCKGTGSGREVAVSGDNWEVVPDPGKPRKWRLLPDTQHLRFRFGGLRANLAPRQDMVGKALNPTM